MNDLRECRCSADYECDRCADARLAFAATRGPERDVDEITEQKPDAKPFRAFRLVAKFEADTREDLARTVYQFADAIEREEVTVGCIGGSTDSVIYELLSDPSITHEKYFAELQDYLKRKGH